MALWMTNAQVPPVVLRISMAMLVQSQVIMERKHTKSCKNWDEPHHALPKGHEAAL